MGGVGKTQLAVEYAYRYREDYEIVWWITADQSRLIEPNIATLAARLGLPSGQSHAHDVAVVLEALRRGSPFGRWLLIFDNADDPGSVIRFLLDGPGHTLVTSRNLAWGGYVAETVPINVFTRRESIQFLNKRVRHGIAAADADALADALGDLPLALEHAGAVQDETGMPVAEYLQLFEEHGLQLLASPGLARYPVPVTAAWQVSIQQLTELQPESVELLRFCSFFGPQPIPRDVLREGRNAVSPSLRPILSDPIHFSRAVAGLGRYSLAKVDVQRRTLQVHPVVQVLVREDLPTQDRERFQHDVHRLLAAATPYDPDDSSAWQRFRELVPHVEPTGLVGCHDSEVRRSIRSMARFHYMTGDFSAARELADQALARWPTDPDTAPADVIAIKSHLGTVLRAQGDYRSAFEADAAAMMEATEQLGPEHIETLRITNSHGADLRAAGEFRAALALDEDSLRRHIAAFGETDIRTLNVRNNLALDQALLSDFGTARRTHQYVCEEAKKVLRSETHTFVLVAGVNLARAFRLCGEYADGLLSAEDAWAACRNNLGATHPITMRAMTDFVITERLASGGTEKAVTDAEDVYVRHTELAGRRHPSTVAAAIALANACRTARILDRATPLAEQAVQYCQDLYGTDHPHTHSAVGNLALLRRVGGDAGEARRLHEASVTRLLALLGPDHHFTLTCAMGLASDMAATGDLTGAQDRGRDTAARFSRILGLHHPITLACRINLAADLKALGLDAEAGTIRADALERFGKTLGHDHPAVRAAHDGKRLDCDFDPLPS